MKILDNRAFISLYITTISQEKQTKLIDITKLMSQEKLLHGSMSISDIQSKIELPWFTWNSEKKNLIIKYLPSNLYQNTSVFTLQRLSIILMPDSMVISENGTLWPGLVLGLLLMLLLVRVQSVYFLQMRKMNVSLFMNSAIIQVVCKLNTEKQT